MSDTDPEFYYELQQLRKQGGIDVSPRPPLFALDPIGEHHWLCSCAVCRPDANRIIELYKRRNSEAKITM